MADIGDIREGMQVLGSDGGMVGRVTGLHDDHIHVEPDAPDPAGGERIVPRGWVARVDDHVHLNRDAALVRDTWTSHGAGAATTTAAVASDRDGRSWLPWLLGLVLLAAIIFLGVRGCSYAADEADYTDNAKGELSETERAASGASAAGVAAMDSDVATYLAGSDATPRTFTFDNLNFDTSSAEIRSENREELAALGRTLAARDSARVRIVGYADARGDAAANEGLGKRRADAVAAALVANGVAAGRIEAVSGGEADPAASNQTQGGQAENRRTQLVIVSR